MLRKKDFKAGGIKFSAWLDTRDRAAFILDTTNDDILPDAMIVIDPDDENPDRKWDDILRKDFDIDPEIVRPRLDNKYQKLDILYTGKDVYQAAVEHINVHGEASGEIIRALKTLRLNAAAQFAQKRILDNQEILAKVSNTMVATKKTKAKIKSDLADLSERLAAQKATVGFEPTKAAASKILKTQSMMEALQEKAKKNELRAKRTAKKIANAEKEIEEFTERLDRLRGMGADVEPLRLPTELAEAEDYEYEDADDSDIAPLIENDPNIVDETKAFRKVDYKEEQEREMSEFKPMQWAPNVDSTQAPTQQHESLIDGVPASQVATGQIHPTPPSQMPSFAPPISTSAPATEYQPTAYTPQPTATPVATPPMRPTAAPGSDASAIARAGMDGGGKKSNEPGSGYYLLLLILVALSIATLYVYQDRLNSRAVPHLEPAVAEQVVEAESPAPIVLEQVEMTEGEVIVPEPTAEEAVAEEEAAFLDIEQINFIENFNEESAQEEVIEEVEVEPVIEEEIEVVEEDFVEMPEPLETFDRNLLAEVEDNAPATEEPEIMTDGEVVEETPEEPVQIEGDEVISPEEYLEPEQVIEEEIIEEVPAEEYVEE